METMTILPDLQGRKFGTVPLGYDRIDQIRTEFGALGQVASLVLGVPLDTMTARTAGDFVAEVNSLMARYEGHTSEALVEALATLGSSRPQVMAWALAFLRAPAPASASAPAVPRGTLENS